MSNLVNFFFSFEKLMKEKLVIAFFWLAAIRLALLFAEEVFDNIGLDPIGWLFEFGGFFVSFMILLVGARLLSEIAIAIFRINDNLSPDGGKSETADIDPIHEALKAAEEAKKAAEEAARKATAATKSAVNRNKAASTSERKAVKPEIFEPDTKAEAKAAPDAKPAAKKTTAAKTATAKKAATKKAPAKKATTAKPAAKTTATKKAPAKKTTAKSTATKKPAAKKAPANKTPPKKSTEKPVSKDDKPKPETD